jgi:hypothetical protein
MSGAIPPLPEYFFMRWCLVKHLDNFTFYPVCPHDVVLNIRDKFICQNEAVIQGTNITRY